VEANNQLKKAQDASSATPTTDEEKSEAQAAWKHAREVISPLVADLKTKNPTLGQKIDDFWTNSPVSQGGATKGFEVGKSVVHAVNEFEELLNKSLNVNCDVSKSLLNKLLATVSPLRLKLVHVLPKAQQFTYAADVIKNQLLETVIPRNPPT